VDEITLHEILNSMDSINKEIPFYTRFADLKRLDFIKERLANSISTGGKVLDVGCGNGIITMHLGKVGYEVYGIDMSEKAIANATAKNPFKNVVFSVMDAETLRAAGERYDAIICSEVLEHLHEPSKLLSQLYQILNDNGVLLVTVPNGTGPRESLVTKPYLALRKKNNWAWRSVLNLKKALGYSGTTVQSAADNLDHIQFFTKSQLKKLSSDNGFTIYAMSSSNFIDDVFPVSIVASRSMFLQKIDSKAADLLPVVCTGGYLMEWRKSKQP
jgi:ubiquinone/menaquinone biosynthesis C-methylase UbiE